MTACVVCSVPDGEPHEAAEGWQCCWRAWARMAGALRSIPDLVVELHGLGYVVRNGRSDPVAHVLPSGPLNGSKGSPRVNGSREAPIPIRIDPTDLLASSRMGSLSVAITGLYPSDQIGHLAVATELEFWVRDWADIRREGIPLPNVRELSRWLLDRLEWACAHHPAIDEFAEKVRQIRSALTAAAGRFDAPPETLAAPCDSCGMLSLFRDVDLERVACGSCARLMTEDEYATYARWLIKENPS